MANENPKLIVLFEDKKPKEIPLEKAEYVLGRLPKNDIPLKDEYISSIHSKIVKQQDGKYKIIDKNSTNGTFVNQKNVSEKLLENNDIIQLGRIQLKFNYETQESKPSKSEETDNKTDKHNRASSKTGISLEEEEIKNKKLPVDKMKNVSPFEKHSDNKIINKIITIFVISLTIIAVCLLIYIFFIAS